MSLLLVRGVTGSQYGRLNLWRLHFSSALHHFSDQSALDNQECLVRYVVIL